ncbi:DUF72 domain-containing protein [Paenibacillus sp. FSL H7-0331]|uniref:DUF72 domain-containing protein n=1 Tax=Paenibacillus sp. FSL H7-0331 TaxID=1920421 RepID=UPI00097017DA|nr:DUF72 domain-containing protein [Paenibacillus sp. FSL H7-0331]OMF20522.1 hypothetical protein BK127_00215 [Paenibacillus sp. FSL H7-0331]
MIKIGLTGFGDHEELYGKLTQAKRLPTYSEHFPIVELDSPFYAVQPVKNYLKWVNDTPKDFGFIVKAYQGMTGHLRGKKNFFDTTDAMYEAFHISIQPVIDAGKLAMALFQYPPWFECSRENVAVLRDTRKRMGAVPCALEFRHQSWYAPEFRERTLDFMSKENWIHTIVDEPQAGEGSIPIVSVATSPEITYVRMHGRNVQGWHQSNHPDWRKLRYLYRYNTQELTEWRDRLLELEKSCKHIYVVFNNNSGGDATDNAKELMQMLGLETQALPPKQADLFEDIL